MDAASEQIPAGSMRSNIRALRTPGKEGAAKESSGGWATCSGRKHWHTGQQETPARWNAARNFITAAADSALIAASGRFHGTRQSAAKIAVEFEKVKWMARSFKHRYNIWKITQNQL